MSGLSWFLVPAAAAAGWLAARLGARRCPRTSEGKIRSDYFKGLNFLLNEQPDKAIQVFVRMLEVDSDTIETHFALGNLFRRRGEVDRAIHIHQNLIARTNLASEYRSQALFELGEDYMRAGLLDRAENLFQELIELKAHVVPALRHLVELYQQEKDWEKAIANASRLERECGTGMGAVIAQHHCELAEAARRKGQPERAGELVADALLRDPHCVRASLLEAELAMAAEGWEPAIRALRRVEEQDRELVPEILAPLELCHRRAGDPGDYLRWLRELLARRGGVAVMLALADGIRQSEGREAAEAFVVGELRKTPSVRGLERLIDLQLGGSDSGRREGLLVLKELTRRLLEGRPLYRCQHCGFSGRTLYWQCPTCKKWNTVKPSDDFDGG